MSRLAAGAGVAVRDAQGRILLVRRRVDGAWGCPGGHVEFGESWADCAQREFHEETGGEVDLFGLLGVYSEPRYQVAAAEGAEHVHFIGVIFEGRLVGSLGTASDDVTEVGWFDPTGLPSPLWNPDVPVIHDACSSAVRPFIR